MATPGESEAIELVGLWRASGAAGESDQTWLRLDAGRFDTVARVRDHQRLIDRR